MAKRVKPNSKWIDSNGRILIFYEGACDNDFAWYSIDGVVYRSLVLLDNLNKFIKENDGNDKKSDSNQIKP